LNWPNNFQLRLSQWNFLRQQVANYESKQALDFINLWWFRAPWRAYHLHWDDWDTWPDPWQLLSDNMFCDVARGLGIMYTISLLDRADLADAELILTTDGYNLVQVCDSKYILNWQSDTIVNINLAPIIKHKLTLNQLKTKYNL
jgi:hypothetical protein